MLEVGILGYGYWGPNLARNFNQLRGANLHTICDLGDDRIAYVREHYPNVNTTKDYREVLSNPEINAVVIALPASLHYRFAKEVLLADKDVLVEKPLALKVDEAKELIQIAEEKDKVLMVGHTFEYNVAVRKVKEYIDAGELGNIYYIYSQRLNLGRVRADVNAMWNLAPHDVSIVLYWLGEEPAQVSARGITFLQKGIEDVVFLNLDFADGRSAHIHTSWLDPSKVRKMTIVGSKKMIVYDDVSSEDKVKVYDKGIAKKNISDNLGQYDDFGKFQLIQRAGDILTPKINFVEPLMLECSHFIECVENRKKPLTDGENGLRVVKVLAAAQKSLYNGGMAVDTC